MAGIVCHLGDGRWWDAEHSTWRDGFGKPAQVEDNEDLLALTTTTRVVLAAAHRDHHPTNIRACNLVALCRRCHLAHDREGHQRGRWITLFRRKALGDLFVGRYGWDLFPQTRVGE